MRERLGVLDQAALERVADQLGAAWRGAASAGCGRGGISTVRTLMKSCSAISALVWPSAISRRTSTLALGEVVGRPVGLGGPPRAAPQPRAAGRCSPAAARRTA